MEIRAGGQVQKPTTPQTTSPTTSKPNPQQGTAPRGGGQGANQGAPAGPGRGGPRSWWRDEAIRKEVGLREDQVKQLEKLYEDRSKSAQTQLLTEEMEKQSAELDRLMNDRNAGTAAI